MNTIKRCNKCAQDKLTSEFRKDKRTPDGLKYLCRECQKKAEKQYRDMHPDRVKAYADKFKETHPNLWKAYQKRYYAKRRDEIRDKHREYYQRTRETANERGKRWREQNPDKERQRHVAYAQKHPEKSVASVTRYRRRHPERQRTILQRRRARQLDLPSTFTNADWQRALDYFGHTCAVCNRPVGLWHTLAQDHWIPVAKGGGYTPDNIVPLCHGQDGCNNSKNARDPIEWLDRKFGARKAKQILARVQAYFAWVNDHLSPSPTEEEHV